MHVQPARWIPTASRNHHYRQRIFSMGWSWLPRCPVRDPTSRGSTGHATSAGKDRWRARSISGRRVPSARLTADSVPSWNGRRRREGRMPLLATARAVLVSCAECLHVESHDADLHTRRSLDPAVRCHSRPVKSWIHSTVQR